MHGIPEHSRLLLERLLSAYCARICPPRARHTVLLGFLIEHDRASLSELRLTWGVPGTRRAVPLAQLRYDAADQSWRLLFVAELRREDPGAPRWQRYPGLAKARGVIELLREIDADPRGLFWPRIDGKSLRWCSSRGRCLDCDAQYCSVLGIEPPAQAARLLPSPAMAR